MSWQPYIKPPAACGTDAGYYRHRDTRGGRTPTDPCDACKAAHSKATNDRAREQRRRAAKVPGRYDRNHGRYPQERPTVTLWMPTQHIRERDAA